MSSRLASTVRLECERDPDICKASTSGFDIQVTHVKVAAAKTNYRQFRIEYEVYAHSGYIGVDEDSEKRVKHQLPRGFWSGRNGFVQA